MSPTTRLTRRNNLPLPMIFGATRFPELSELMDNALELFPELSRVPQFASTGVFPAVNVGEDATGFTITAELPGMTEKDVNVDFTDGVLTIKGEKTEEHKGKEDGTRYHIWERRSGSFQRSFPFPGGISDDKITADFNNGVLNVRLPKAPEEQEKSRSIKINAK